jgi:type III secretion protein R
MTGTSSTLVFALAAGFFLLAILTLTSFVKLSVVFMIIRQALGLQQVPSNMIVMALAAFMAVFISMPVFSEAMAAVREVTVAPDTPQGLFELWSAGIGPFQGFISRNTDPQSVGVFVDIANEVWAGSGLSAAPDNFIIQVPAFLVSELTEAFKIGFLLYLPFVAIDLAVTGILMALGMQMVQPNVIAVPFKLLTFVFVDGWAQLVQGLVLTYSGA